MNGAKSTVGIFSFFSGAGFLDLGFEKTPGFEVLFVNEYHAPFVEIYEHSRQILGIKKPRFGMNVKSIEDFVANKELEKLRLSIVQAKQDYAVTGFIGGPPCPDFSVGGKNKGQTGENGRLSGTYVKLICETTPDFFLFENVKGLWRTKKHRMFYESLKKQLVDNGYFLTERLINSLDYGAPQDRERIILIGFHKKYLTDQNYDNNGTNFLWDFDWNYARKYDSRKLLKLDWPILHPFNQNSDLHPPKNLPLELTVEHWFGLNDVVNHPNSQMYFQPKAGLAKFLRIEEGDVKKKSYKRLHRWRYSPTVAYGNNEVHLHPSKPRRISVSEALSLQSLPKEFVIPTHLTLTNAFKAIGNGVPFLAGKGLAEAILNFISQIDSNFKEKLDGEIDSTKSSSLYQPIAEAEQLSLLEPEEPRPY